MMNQQRQSVEVAHRRLGLLLLPALLVAAVAASAEQPPASPPAAASPPQPPAVIDGFREAHFGMTGAALRQAIRKDFPKAKVVEAVQPTEKTTVLFLTASDLLPDTPPAQVSYILGYRSKQLIQVNIVWSSDGKDATSDEAVVGTANQLRDYFGGQNFPPDKTVRNQKLGDDTILVFRGTDPAGHMVVLVLSGTAAAGRKAKHPTPPPLHLELSYVADTAHPDIFQIRKGQF